MESLVPHLRAHFDSLQDRMLCFTTQGVQIEGWFKGETLFLLEQLAKQRVVESFDREVPYLGKRIDLCVVSEQRNWIELKHWLVGRQKGTLWGPSNYFRDASSVGIVGDVRKLHSCPVKDCRWLLILAAANPGVDLWEKGVEGFNDKFNPLRVKSHTDPAQFPSSYFLGLLSVQQLTDSIEEPLAVPPS